MIWDVTCCDLEPATLGKYLLSSSRDRFHQTQLTACFTARNIFLFSLLLDKVRLSACWNVFYHLYIRGCDLDVIHRQAMKLVRCSRSMNTWSSSSLGKRINFLSEDTLQQLRYFWSKYFEVADMHDEELEEFEKPYRNSIKRKLGYLGDGPFAHEGYRSAGPHWKAGGPTLYSAFQAYWRTGVVAGNTHDVEDLGPDGRGRLNPLFTFSSSPDGSFAVHMDTDPLLGFHLAACFDDKNHQKQEFLDKLAAHAKGQFRSWCKTFRTHLCSKTLRLNIFCGDAVRFCHELQAVYYPEQRRTKLTRTYAAPWKSAELVLQGLNREDKDLFDVIESSNLIDHVGALNALPAIAPLLSRRVTSVIFTDTLQKASKNYCTSLVDVVGCDVATLSLILGLTPVTYLVGFVADSTAAEAPRSVGRSGHDRGFAVCFTRIAWKVADFGDPVQDATFEPPIRLVEFNEPQLAKFCYQLYLNMFRSESSDELAKSVLREASTPYSTSPERYTRLSFVLFLDIIKRNVQIEWEPFIHALLEDINGDVNLFAGRNSFQELQVSLYLCGLYRNMPVALPPRGLGTTPYGPVRPCSSEKGLLARENPPSVVFATLVVPRESLKPFTKQDPRTVGLPAIQMNVVNRSIKMLNSHCALQSFFGKLTPRSDDDARFDVVSDRLGWKGEDNLIVCVPIATWTLLVGPREGLKVNLTVSTSATGAHYAFTLGPEMEIFGCGLEGEELHILSEPPGATFKPIDLPEIIAPECASIEEVCLATMGTKAETTSLHMYTPFVKLKDNEITVTQESPCVLKVQPEGAEPFAFRYPLPIDGTRHEKKFLVEDDGLDVVAPISHALADGGYDHNPFPVCMQEGRTTTPTIQHIKLDKLPTINVEESNGETEELLGWILSAAEDRLAHDGKPECEIPALVELKAAIGTLFEIYLPFKGKLGIFELSRKQELATTLIFVSSVRHNEYQTVVIDAYVVTLTGERYSSVRPFIAELFEEKKIMDLFLGAKSAALWKKLLPAQVESCRTTWTHGENCEYRVKRRIPLSTEEHEVAICTCGEGQEVDNFPRVPHWEQFAKYATRLAIPPISTVPIVEAIIPELASIRLSEFPPDPPAATPAASTAAPVKRDKCDNCGKESEKKLKGCPRCDTMKYCNHACRKADWKAHKKQCRKG